MANDGSLFITCNKNVMVTSTDGKETHPIPAGYIGPVPSWVESHWYFKALTRDGTITAVVRTSDEALEAAKKEAAEKEAKARAEAEMKAAIDKAVADAEVLAKAEAEELGYDKKGAAEHIKKAKAQAKEKAQAEFK